MEFDKEKDRENKGYQRPFRAGYQYLLAWKITVPIYDYTVVFCNRCGSPNYPDFPNLSSRRTFDQMVQSARSGTTNIPEGNTQDSTEGYLKLTGVNRGSLEELLNDFLAYARQNKIEIWGRERSVREIREIGIIWEILKKTPTLPDSPNFPNLPKDPTKAVNLLITLINQANFLQTRLKQSVEKKFVETGGFRENLFRKRREFKGNQGNSERPKENRGDRENRGKIKTLIFFLISPLIFLISLIFFLTVSPRPVLAVNSGIFTISAWVKPETSVASKAIVGKSEELRVFTNASGYLGCQIKSTTWQTASQATTTALTLNTWSFVACTYDKVTLRVYLNGSQVGSQALTATIDDTAAALKYGIDDSASTPYSALKGTIDELKFYNYARSAKQIVEDMNAGHPAVGSPVGSAVAHYEFDEGYGTTTNNSGFGGLGLLGTLGTGSSSPTWTNNGKFGKALSFDGNDKVYKTDSTGSPLDITSGISVSAWINPPTIDSSEHTIVEKGYSTAWEFDMDNYGGLKVNAYHGGAYESDMLTTNSYIITANQWQHVIWTYDGNITKIYLNGKVVASGNETGDLGTNNSTLYIGTRASSSLFFSGLIDEVKIYNYALTEDEVKLDYNRGSAIQMGSLSSGTGNTAPATAASQEYCVPGDGSTCSPPIAEWKFEEGVGSSAFDTSGNSNTGTLNSPSWTNGKIGKALNFDGTNDCVSAGTSNNLNLTADLTISAWIYPKGWGQGNYGRIFERSNDSNAGFRFNLFSTNSKLAFVAAGGNDAYSNNNSISLSTWQHVSITRSGTNVTFYVNGNNQGSGTINTISSYAGGTGYVGCLNTNYRGFNGLIDQVRIYNYARSAKQISWDYNRGAPIAHYKFDECEGAVAHDSAGVAGGGGFAGNNGTITVGASGTQSTLGTCSVGTGSTAAWGNGSVGKYNASLNFDGTDDYVDISSFTFNDSGAYSTSFWFKPGSDTGAVQYLTDIRYADSAGQAATIGFDYGNNNEVDYAVYGGGTWLQGSVVLSSGSWYHVVIVHNSNDNTIKSYINSRLDLNTTTSDLTVSASPVRIAARRVTQASPTNGQIDDVKIFNYGLTAQQIKLLYNDGAVHFGPPTGAP